MGTERRKAVRVRPLADYNLTAELVSGLVSVPLMVVDVGVGGLGLFLDQLMLKAGIGDTLSLRVTLPDLDPFDAVVTIRHTRQVVGGACGVQFTTISDEARDAVQKFVSELLERGSSA